MVIARSFKETNINYSRGESESKCLDIDVPLPTDDHRGILSNFSNEISASWTGDTSIGFENSDDPEDIYYMNCVATAGGSFIRALTRENEPRTIVWRVLRKSTVLELNPIDMNSTSKLLYRKIRIHTPAAFLGNCITICENTDTGYIVIDFITEVSHLYTLSFSFSEFTANPSNSMSDKGHSLSESNATNWRSINYPYTFDLKKPHLLHSVSHRSLVASTRDGVFIHLDRDTPLGKISVTTFQEPTNSHGLSRFLSWGLGDLVHGKSKISDHAAVSMLSIPQENLLVTLAVNRILRLWSLDSYSLLAEQELTPPGDDLMQRKINIGPQPMKLLSIPAWKDDFKNTGSIVLCTYFPLGDGLFKFWRLNFGSTGKRLIDLGKKYELVPEIPDSFSTYFVSDFHILDHSGTEDKLQLSIMWKSNISSALYQVSVPLNSGSENIWYVACETEESDLQYFKNANVQENESEYYLERIFGTYGYSEETVQAALPIYANRYAILLCDPSETDDAEQTLQKNVCHTVGAAVSLTYKSNGTSLDYDGYRSALTQEWNLFDRLCFELQRPGNEVLSFDWDPVLELFWIVKASFFSLVRPALPVEIVYHNIASAPNRRVSAIVAGSVGTDLNQATKILQTLDSLAIFRSSLSHVHYGKIMQAIRNDYNPNVGVDTTERMEKLYNTFLKSKGPVPEISDLHVSLLKIGNIDETLSFLLASVLTAFKPSEKKNGTILTTSGCYVALNALSDVLILSRLVVSDVLLALLVTVFTKEIVPQHAKIYSKYLKVLKAIDAMLAFLSVTSVNTGSEIDCEIVRFQNLSLTSPVNSRSNVPFFHDLILSNSSNSSNTITATINRKGFSQLLGEIWSYWSINDRPLSASLFITQLLELGDTTELYKIERFLPHASFSTFIRAHIHLKFLNGSKARFFIQEASAELGTRKLSLEELEIVKLLDFGTYSKQSFGNGVAQYFLSASRAALTCEMTVCALQLARDAQKNLFWGTTSDKGEKSKKIEEKDLKFNREVCDHLFDTAIKAYSYYDAYGAVMELARLSDYAPGVNPDHAKDLIADDEGDSVVPYVETLACSMVESGNGTQLCQYPFVGLIDVVSDLFLRKARTSLLRATIVSPPTSDTNKYALLYYHAMYSWNVEHHDFRGGKFFFYIILFYLRYLVFVLD